MRPVTSTPGYHHSRSLQHVSHGTVKPARLTELLRDPGCAAIGTCDPSDDWHFALQLEACYRWLAERIGFWPLFLAVGDTDEDRRMTGYQLQWSRSRTISPTGPPRDQVLFSWSDAPAHAIYVDYLSWHTVLNSVRARNGDPHELYVELEGRRDDASILKPSWRQSDWLRHARRNPHSVQAAVPALDLSTADEICAPSRRVATALIHQGFAPSRLRIQRLRLQQ